MSDFVFIFTGKLYWKVSQIWQTQTIVNLAVLTVTIIITVTGERKMLDWLEVAEGKELKQLSRARRRLQSQRLGSVVPGHRIAPGLPAARHQRVARVAVGAFAYGDMATGLALCIHTALVLARINTLIIAAGPVVRAVFVHLTLALDDGKREREI